MSDLPRGAFSEMLMCMHCEGVFFWVVIMATEPRFLDELEGVRKGGICIHVHAKLSIWICLVLLFLSKQGKGKEAGSLFVLLLLC